MKNFFFHVRNMTLIVAAAAFLGLLLLMVAYSLPNEKIYNNVKASLHIYEIEHDHYIWGLDKFPTYVDNFTNIVMLMEAIYPVKNGVLDSALVNRMWSLEEGNSPAHSLINGINSNREADLNKDKKYGRYWHGYLIFLKPLLYKTTVGSIRLLNSYIQLFLIAIAAVLLYKKLGMFYVFAFILTVAAINPVTTALCFQNSTVFYVLLFAVIALLLKNEFIKENARYIYFFLIVGICTSYFDFLTYPFVSLGVPLCLFVVLNKEKFFIVPIKEVFKKLFGCLFAWCFGYAGMWASKWILATTLTDYNALADTFYNAIESKLSAVEVIAISPDANASTWDYIKFLFSPQHNLPQGYAITQEITAAEVFYKNIHALFDTPFAIIFALFILFMIFRMIKNKFKPHMNLNILIIFAFIAALPFVWYFIVIKHSEIHFFFVHRELAISVFAIACFFIELGLKKTFS